MREKITTTEAKAKELKSKIDRVIKKAKKARLSGKKMSGIRELAADIPKEAIAKLMGEFSDRFESRNSGYSRVIKLGARRKDGARMAVIEFV